MTDDFLFVLGAQLLYHFYGHDDSIARRRELQSGFNRLTPVITRQPTTPCRSKLTAFAPSSDGYRWTKSSICIPLDTFGVPFNEVIVRDDTPAKLCDIIHSAGTCLRLLYDLVRDCQRR